MAAMAATWKPAAELLVDDLQNVFGTRLEAVVAYGAAIDGDTTAPLTCLVLVSSLSAEDLLACARCGRRWERAHVATPLVLPTHEFTRSLDTFPLEYGEIIRAHAPVFGSNPLASAIIAPEDLRRACELQAKSLLLHLREAFMESGGRPDAVAALVSTSAPAFTSLLRNVARLNGVSTGDRTEATRAGAHAAGVAETVVTDMLTLERHAAMSSGDPSRLFPDYLAAVEQLARAVDRWRT
jgi:hypothetical protein